MSFVPPRCPNSACPEHLRPGPRFFRRAGVYRAWCHDEPVPRFRCKACRRGFSRQTFRAGYRDRRPDLNAELLALVASGVGLRQCGRLLGLDIHSVQHKLRKIARTCEQLHENLSPQLPGPRTFLMDEEETYETASIRPLTMPVVIERETWFVVATAVGPIRRLAPRGTARRRAQEREDRLHGRRPDHSRRCVTAVLRQLERRIRDQPLVLRTDQKASYRAIARQVFAERVVHETTSSRRLRDWRNPLFPINTTLAMTRDNCGRLRRRSWLVTKKRERLQAQLHVFAVYRNYVRRRFNRDRRHQTPAWFLGLLPRELRPAEVVAWRQDWGHRSILPTSADATRSVGDHRPVAPPRPDAA